jgi:hypothetical protein|nr:MAG TPA: hypothetical protein [Caudoviricetes sp.]
MIYMRDATQEETNSVNEHIKSISTDTGVTFYDSVDDYIKNSIKELRELREYKNKVEEFISKYDGSIVLLPGEVVLTSNQCIQKLKEELGYGDQL